MEYLAEHEGKIYWNGRRMTPEEFVALGFRGQLRVLAQNAMASERVECINAVCCLCSSSSPLAFYASPEPEVLNTERERRPRRGYIHSTTRGLMTCEARPLWIRWAMQLDTETP